MSLILNPDELEKYLDNSIELTKELRDIDYFGTAFIPTNKFNEFELTRFAFGEAADDYGRFLEEYGIKQMSIWLPGSGDKIFAKKVYFAKIHHYGSGGLNLVHGARI